MANRGYWEDGAVWFSADNLNGMLLQYGNTASRSDFGQQGRVHFDTDRGVESYDTGTGWMDKQWGTRAYRGGSITLAKMAANSVDTEQLVTDSVTQAKMAVNSVGSAQIIDGSVGASELASSSVSNSKIQNSAVSDAKISTLSMSKLRGDLTDIPGISVSTDAPTNGTGSHGDIWLQRLA